MSDGSEDGEHLAALVEGSVLRDLGWEYGRAEAMSPSLAPLLR